MVTMRHSKVLNSLRNQQMVKCTKLNSSCHRVVELAALSGFDCIWLDMEHVPNAWQVIEKQILAAKAHDVDTLVRVARGSYSDLIKPLEADATGIMVPHIMSLQDAKNVIKQTRFHPIGRRPVDGGNADGSFGLVSSQDYFATANRERFVVLQIEDPEPLDELDAIAALEGYDMLFFGPGDFAHSLGLPGESFHPDVNAVRQKVVQVAHEYGKYAGTTAMSREDLKIMTELGYDFIGMGADVVGLAEYYRQLVQALDEINLDLIGAKA